MRKNLSVWLDKLGPYEGGFADRPLGDDPGGATNRGITLATYRRYCKDLGKPEPTISDLKALDGETQCAIAAKYYWNPIKGDALPGGVDMYLADFAFMSGGAVKVLQRDVLGFAGSDVDGDIGPKTLAAVKAMDPKTCLQNLHSARLEYLRGLSNYAANKSGWERRCVDLFQSASDHLETVTLPAERPPIQGRTFWGAAIAALAMLPDLATWLTGNADLVRQFATAAGLPPASADGILHLAGAVGAIVVIYARYSDHAKAKEAAVS